MPESDATKTALPDDPAPRGVPTTGATLSRAPSDVTGTFSSDAGGRPADAPADVTVPGYELLDELGRGGMGVVYKARDTRLNRVVALKMIRRDERAGARQIVRFLAEAEAIAAIHHPHVVRVYEFGEAGGRPFITFEYLPGGSLADRLGAPLPPRVAAEVLIQIAGGVAAAHEQGIVHRDVKPDNVLFNAAGAPTVTDFGLAKRNAGSDLTATQAVMGTPAYMSPEQAGGNAKFVGPQADVWALGVILYEALTGARPFAGDDVRELLARVMLANPTPPRKVVPAIPRDLELICLKCLAKLPHERYPTAKEAADDLGRYARGEPISVRPAGPLERALKWVKRNRAVSGAAAAVVLALVTGSAVSLGFGIEARKQADEARKQKREADDAAERERREAVRADRERADAVAARTELRRTLVKALFAPIAAKDPHLALTSYERETFWQIAELRRDDASWALVEDGTHVPFTRDQLMNRPEHVLHAVVGLDVKRRDDVDRLLLKLLRQEPGTPQAVAWAQTVARWGGHSRQLSEAAAEVLLAALRKEKSADACWKLAWHLSAAAGRLDPAAAAKALADAADHLHSRLEKVSFDDVECWKLARGLVAVAAQMAPPVAATNLNKALGSVAPYTDACQELAEAVVAVAARLDPAAASAERATAAGHLCVSLDTGTSKDRQKRAWSVAAVVTGVSASDEVDGHQWARWLIQAFDNESDEDAREALATALAKVAAVMEPVTAFGSLAAALEKEKVTEKEKATAWKTRRRLREGMSTAAARMEPAVAVEVLTASLKNELSTDDCDWSAARLAEAAVRLAPAAAANTLSSAADLLFTALDEEAEATRRRFLTGTLVSALAKPFASAALDAASTVILHAPNDESERPTTAKGLVAVAAKMEAPAASKVLVRATDLLLTILKNETNPSARRKLAGDLAAVAAHERLEPGAAAELSATAATVICAELHQKIHAHERRSLATNLVAVAKRMDRAGALKACSATADTLLGALKDENLDDSDRYEQVEGLAAVVEFMEPAAAAKACASAVNVLRAPRETTQHSDPWYRAAGLVVISERMGLPAAIDLLTSVLVQEKDGSARQHLAQGLASALDRKDGPPRPEVRAAVVKLLVAELNKDADSETRMALAGILAAVAVQSEPRSAGATHLAAFDALDWVDAPSPLAISQPTQFEQLHDIFPARLDFGEVLASAVQGSLPEGQRSGRNATIFAVGSFATPGNLIPSLPLLHSHLQPHPRPLPPQALVDLLKHPLCVGDGRRVVLRSSYGELKQPFSLVEPRRAVLDALELTYQRKFKDLWEFVEYAQKHQPQLDLLSPPKRPQP